MLACWSCLLVLGAWFVLGAWMAKDPALLRSGNTLGAGFPRAGALSLRVFSVRVFSVRAFSRRVFSALVISSLISVPLYAAEDAHIPLAPLPPLPDPVAVERSFAQTVGTGVRESTENAPVAGAPIVGTSVSGAPVAGAPISEAPVFLALPPLPDIPPFNPAALVPPAVPVPAAKPAALALEDALILAKLEPMRARLGLERAQIGALAAFYAARNYAPLWGQQEADGFRLGAKALALVTLLQEAESEGLDRTRLRLPLPDRVIAQAGGAATALSPEQAIEADLGLSLAAFLYAYDARGGRVDPARLSALITARRTLPDMFAVLSSLERTDQIAAALQAWLPDHAGYRALRAALAKTRLARVEDPAPAPLAEPRSLNAHAVAGLPGAPLPQGALPAQPVTLSTRPAAEEAVRGQIVLNMERWRWLPPDLGDTHVFVSVPDFRLDLMRNGASVHQARVIVGKPATQTPIFSDAIDHLIVNPSWYVPPSILKKEFLPNLQKDPGYAAKRGYEVVRSGKHIGIRQPPGEKNALGAVKFMFPNLHSVYLHDTPGRHLFAHETRALSHGCIRVDKPFAFAEQLLAGDLALSEGHLRGMVGRGERRLKLNRKVPVHLTYFTLRADETGAVQNVPDLYGYDSRLKAALGL